MEAKKHSAFWRGAIILTLASLITKVLSAFYRIPYQNIAGDLGFYIYQQVYPFYGICLVLAVYGFPIIISKLVAERIEKGTPQEVNQVIFVSFWFLTVLGFTAFCSLYFGSVFIADVMGDGRLAKLLKAVSFSFLFMPFLSIVRGYFQGIGEMIPTAVSQVAEQSIRVAVIVLVSVFFTAWNFDLYDVGVGAVFGSVIGAVAAVIILAFFFKNHIRGFLFQKWTAVPNKKVIIKLIFWNGIAICITNLVLIVMQLIDSVSLYSMLLQAGEKADEAKIMKGVYDRAIPLMQLGTVVATSFSLSLVPVITGATQRKNTNFIRENIRLAMKTAFVIGLAAAAGLVCIIRPVNIMLFKNNDGSDVLAILALSIIFSALSITTASILQGLGKMKQPAFFVMAGAIAKYAGNVLLVPLMGLKGAATATVLSLSIIALLNSLYLFRLLGYPIVERRSVRHIILANFAMMAALLVYIKAFEAVFVPQTASRPVFAAEALTAVVFGGLVYLFFIFKLRVFTKEELGIVFKSEKISGFLKKN
jgi:PST family polysaccharide transporter